MASELERYNIDFAALSESRFLEDGALTEEGSGYTFFWKGLPEGSPRQHGVAIAIRNTLLNKLSENPIGLNERIMSLRLPLTKDQYITIFSVYAPTLTTSEDIKDQFYNNLDSLLKKTPKSDKVVILGDFNARVGTDAKSWQGTIGNHGIGKMNDNGLRLLTFCSQHQLVITNTLFQQPNKYKVSWKHPRSKTWHLLDYVIVRSRDTKDVLSTRAMRGAECWTDHIMIRTKMKLCPRPQARKTKPHARLNVNLLTSPEKQHEFHSHLEAKLTAINETDINLTTQDDIEQLWSTTVSNLLEASTEVLGLSKRNNPDWFDESAHIIQPLITNKNNLHAAHLANPNSKTLEAKWKKARAECQRILRETQNSWWTNKAAQIQSFADENKSYEFYDAIKGVYGPTKRVNAPVRNLNGELLKEKNQVLDRWAEHFKILLNHINPTEPTILDQLPNLPPLDQLETPPTPEEVEKAIKSLKNRKAKGSDGLPGELFKYGGNQLKSHLHKFFTICWNAETIPDSWKHANIITIYKKKGDKADCGNSRGISLLDIAGKIFAKILLMRLLKHVINTVVPESQCGFRKERSTTDMIFASRLILEKCREQQRDLYLAFVDLAKAFDTVNRDLLWTILIKFGCTPKFTQAIKNLHTGMTAKVSYGSDTSDPFDVKVGVKQGCVLAPVLFNIYLVAVTLLSRNDFEDSDGIQLCYRFDGGLFNTRRLQAKTKTDTLKIYELQYADDTAIVSHTPESLQHMLNVMNQHYSQLGLQINARKTEVMRAPFASLATGAPPLQLNGIDLPECNSFVYLGSEISSNGYIDQEVTRRIAQAAASYGRLREMVFNNRNLKLQTKLAVYKAVCVSTLLYGSESWTVYSRHIKQLEGFHIRCLMNILSLSWKDKVPHTEILKRCQMVSIENHLLQRLLRWIGHVIRMDGSRLPKATLFGQIQEGIRKHGGQLKRFRDYLKKQLGKCNIPFNNLENLAADRKGWRALCKKQTAYFEESRTAMKEAARTRKHQRRQMTATPADSPTSSYICPDCGRRCSARIGLLSHQRTHRR